MSKQLTERNATIKKLKETMSYRSIADRYHLSIQRIQQIIEPEKYGKKYEKKRIVKEVKQEAHKHDFYQVPSDNLEIINMKCDCGELTTMDQYGR